MGLTLGSPLVLAEKWDAYRVLELIVKHQVAWGMCVPTHLHMMVDLAIKGEWNRKLTSMRALAVGGSPNTETMVSNAEKYLGLKVLRMFGMSECLGHASIMLDDPPERYLIYDGIPYPGTHLEAYDDEGKVLPRGEIGQAGVRGPSLFLGYLPGLGGEQNCFTPDGAFLTGDLIVRDTEGYVKVVGRMKDQIIRGGLNIDVSEVEESLASHPDVKEAVVVGRPDDRLGERLCAVIVPSSSQVPTLEELCNHVQSLGLAKFKSPEFLVLVQDLPKTEYGKLDKKKMKEMAKKAQP
jgi:acyl-CoA synthetase